MKTGLIILAALWASFASFKADGAGWNPEAERSNYVVIGAFAIRGHADQFVETAKKMNFNAESAINPTRNLYYVFVLHTGDRKIALTEANKIRKASPFSDTWVFTGLLGIGTPIQGLDIHPTTGQTIAAVEIKDETVATTEQVATITPTEVPVTATDSISTTPIAEAEEGSRNFLFKIFALKDQKELQGNVGLIDTEKLKKVASYKGNQNVVVRHVNKSGNISLMCDVFGYRKLQKDLNFDRPQDTEGIVEQGNQTIVPFEMVRLKKGDFSVMYNVYFYRDAAIMRPESRYEVGNLLLMMNENPKYKIRIHGHTNGSAPGKVISMGKTRNFFSLTDTKEGFGTAKKLSEERAKLIREFLISEGVAENRMEVKAWGGKRPVYDKMSPQAQSNVRVEIEIIEE